MKEKNSKKKKMPFWLRILLIFASVVLVICLALFAAYHIALDYYLGKIQYETDPQTEFFFSETLPEVPLDQNIEEPDFVLQTEENETDSKQEEQSRPISEKEPDSFTPESRPAVEEKAQDKAEEMIPAKQIPMISDSKHITNILLMGEDKSGTDKLGLTDVMMLISINTKTKKILMCSLMRDLFLEYPSEPQNPFSGEYTRLNHANRMGGPKLTMAVIKKNFNLDIQYYAKVNFKAFAGVVDTVGGVEVELTVPEIEDINAHHKANAIYVGGEDYPILFLPKKEGTYNLNGSQALTYARIRSIDSDWQRTGRQRKIISAMLKKIPDLSLGQMLEMMEAVLPQITTNIPKEELKKMISALPSYAKFETEQITIPADNKYYTIEYCMIPDLEYNQFYLYEKIMGERAKGDPR